MMNKIIVYGIRVAIGQLINCAYVIKQLKDAIPIPESVMFEPEDILQFVKERLEQMGILVIDNIDHLIIGATFGMMNPKETREEFCSRIDSLIAKCLGEDVVKNNQHIILN